MKLFWAVISLLAITSLQAEEINKKYETNENCNACHMEISKRWATSRHSNSHFSKNDLFKKSLEFMVRKNPTLILDEVKVECAQCHNPRITKKTVEDKDKYLLLMGIEENKKEMDRVLNTKNMQNGINCVVCHNIDEIHLDKSKGSQGMNTVKFGEQGTMFGPFDDAVSPYHKTAQRAHFMTDEPTLCFVCHYSTPNKHGVEVYATGKEYDATGSNEGCKDCHMSEKYEGFASNYSQGGGKPKPRMVREHRFASVDNSNIMINYIDVKSSTKRGKFILTLKNKSPHAIPTGYGLREIILHVDYFDKTDKKVGEDRKVLETRWVDAKGEETIPHLAASKSKDTRLQGKATQDYEFDVPQGADYAKYTFSYRLINEKMAKELGVTDPFFLKEYIFSERRIHLN
ncbi:multiheme c-type cytochrome [Sulfurovum sp. zt1-1]|uniref:Multiheme c-type cytochrome n=1 Tax=Sulfurovum zhangzhouensis TaxID=3019067 RepID=A0ABT7QZC6_9BACT|nr:multiheme c-type cytochrome [Sulfurovum zhangzhouensis]MDM5272201.1 multiheme c-type cytochrome [Sulfurovum zhangzhouensis]